MTESSRPLPTRTPTRPWRLAVLAAVGAAAPLTLALFGQASIQAAGGAAAIVAVIGWALLVVGRRASRPPSPAQVSTERPWTPPFAAMLDRLADPILLIQGGEREDLSGRRFMFANAAARACCASSGRKVP